MLLCLRFCSAAESSNKAINHATWERILPWTVESSRQGAQFRDFRCLEFSRKAFLIPAETGRDEVRLDYTKETYWRRTPTNLEGNYVFLCIFAPACPLDADSIDYLASGNTGRYSDGPVSSPLKETRGHGVRRTSHHSLISGPPFQTSLAVDSVFLPNNIMIRQSRGWTVECDQPQLSKQSVVELDNSCSCCYPVQHECRKGDQTGHTAYMGLAPAPAPGSVV
ncbi:hypothetical protein F4680DRAFT_178062 [Xylaria scruposa]|nr:hypothetical protein F4680DRAFT_178062 [Xylaria scruposa]